MDEVLATRSILWELKQRVRPGKRDILMRFFKTGKGEYGEGDRFLGVMVPQIRELVKLYGVVPMNVIRTLLRSPWHEVRLCALLLLVERYHKEKEERGDLVDFYLAHTDRINNWDLVDLTAPKITGEYALANGASFLYPLLEDKSLWRRRIAIVSTLTLIRKDRFDDTLTMARQLFSDPEPLLHKATGWMLREVGKHDKDTLTAFLDEHTLDMPRTALRYAIERLPLQEKQYYMRLGKE